MVRFAKRLYRVLHTAAELLGGLRLHWSRRDDDLPPFRTRVWEQGRLLITSGVSAKDYYVNGLYRSDVSFDEKAAYVGNFEIWRWLHDVSSADHKYLTDDKVVFENYARGSGIATTRTLLVIAPSSAANARPRRVTLRELERWLVDDGPEDLFLKPTDGIGGRGVLSLGKRVRDDVWEQLPTKEAISVAQILEHVRRDPSESFLVQERLVPEPSLDRFSPDVAHTARVMTVLLEGRAHVVCAALKIGVGAHAADNLLRGQNVVASIDLDTGRLGPGVEVRDSRPFAVDAHPKTRAAIAGFEMPAWRDALCLVERAAALFEMNRISSWDVAFTTKGPIVVEANVVFDPILVQLTHDRGLMSFELMKRFIVENRLQRRVGFGRNPYVRRLGP